MRLLSVGDEEAHFSCEPDEFVYNPIGTVHGGWMCILLDSAAGCAVQSSLPAGVGYSSIEIKVSFLEALHADAGTIEVSGRVLRIGRRVGFAEARLGIPPVTSSATPPPRWRCWLVLSETAGHDRSA